MRRFKSGSTKILIATDIASRGIDVDNITHVVNYDMPLDPESYVHRIGRTARAGAEGIAVSFCGFDEIGLYRQIERRSQIQIPIAQDHDDLTFDAPPPSRSVRKARSGGGYQGNRNNPRTGGRKSYAERNGSGGGGGYGGRNGSRSNESGSSSRTKPRSGGKYRKSNDHASSENHHSESTSGGYNSESRSFKSNESGSESGSKGNYAGTGVRTKKAKVKGKPKAKAPKPSFSARTPKPKKGNGYPRNKPGAGVRKTASTGRKKVTAQA